MLISSTLCVHWTLNTQKSIEIIFFFAGASPLDFYGEGVDPGLAVNGGRGGEVGSEFGAYCLSENANDNTIQLHIYVSWGGNTQKLGRVPNFSLFLVDVRLIVQLGETHPSPCPVSTPVP